MLERRINTFVLTYLLFQAHGHDYINLTCVCPYFINTGMFAGCRPRLFPMLEPAHVAEETLKAVQKNQISCVLPGSARIVFPLKKYGRIYLCLYNLFN